MHGREGAGGAGGERVGLSVGLCGNRSILLQVSPRPPRESTHRYCVRRRVYSDALLCSLLMFHPVPNVTRRALETTTRVSVSHGAAGGAGVDATTDGVATTLRDGVAASPPEFLRNNLFDNTFRHYRQNVADQIPQGKHDNVAEIGRNSYGRG